MFSPEGSSLKSSPSSHSFSQGFAYSRTNVSEPTVFENYVHDLYVDDELVELSLWDTAGTLHAFELFCHIHHRKFMIRTRRI
jgi:GTPase SAR1 family protein